MIVNDREVNYGPSQTWPRPVGLIAEVVRASKVDEHTNSYA